MKTENPIKNYRYYVLTILALGVVIGFMAEPTEDMPLGLWLAVMLATKVCAIFCGWSFYQLGKCWLDENKVPALESFLEKL